MEKQSLLDVKKIVIKLDYSLERTEDRLSLLQNTLMDYDSITKQWYPKQYFINYFTNHYNPNINVNQPLSHTLPICYNLNYMAGYILFNKPEKKDINVTSKQTEINRQKKNTSLQGMVEKEGEAAIQPAKNLYKIPKPTITVEDGKIPEIAEYTTFITALEKEMKVDKESRDKKKAGEEVDKINMKEFQRLKRILIAARQDRLTAKLCLSKQIEFTKVDFTSTNLNFDQDTQYLLPDSSWHVVSRNIIDFGNPEHIKYFLRYYSDLKQSTNEDSQSDMKYIMDSLDELIENSPLDSHLRYIMIKRIDGESREEVSLALEKEMGLKISVGYISNLFNTKIPNVISQYYKNSYEDWYYTFIEKGDYKKCNRCQTNYLRTEKYFRKDKKSKDGLSTICKICRKEQDAIASKKKTQSKIDQMMEG